MAKYCKLTEKEQEIMSMLWQDGPLTVRGMLARYPEPRPHVNTVSTIVRILEEKGFVGHEAVGPGYSYHALAKPEEFRERSLAQLVKNYFNNSYASAVSALAEEEKISVEELREIIDMIENRRKS